MKEMITLTPDSAPIRYLAAKDPKLQQAFDLPALETLSDKEVLRSIAARYLYRLLDGGYTK
jgi:hypothetical protein